MPKAKEEMFTMVLSDSLFSFCTSELRPKTRLHSVDLAGRPLRACICVANWASFLMPREGRRLSKSAIGLAVRALSGGEPEARRQLSADPIVRVLAVPAERSITTCRRRERFPRITKDRQESPVVQDSQTPWTICDLEDVVMQLPGRRVFRELEGCELRHPKGIYGDPEDEFHFRKDVAYQAGDELLKAIQRTGLAKYGKDLAPGRGMLLVLAAGWNTEKTSFCQLDSNGEVWRKADLVALAELCALDGQRLSVVLQKMRELLQRGKADHRWFLNRRVADIVRPAAKRGRGDEDAVFGSGRASGSKRKR